MIRLVTYNIKHGSLKGLDAIAATLATLDPDLVALQEVDVGVDRSHGVDQTAVLGRALGMHALHGPAFPLDGGHYGVGLLSRFPIEAREVVPLPSLSGSAHPDGAEPRVALDARLSLPAGVLGAAGPVHLVVTHLGLEPAERLRQAETLIGHVAYRPRTVLAGDLNEGPLETGGTTHTELAEAPEVGSRGGFRLLASSLVDCLAEAGLGERRTFPSWAPELALDHVLRSRDVPPARHARRVQTDASDHLPVLVELG